MLQRVAACCSALQCVAVRYSVLQCARGGMTFEKFHQPPLRLPPRVLQCIAVCCSVLQCVSVSLSVLQCVVVCCSVLQCVAVCCSVLQCASPSSSASTSACAYLLALKPPVYIRKGLLRSPVAVRCSELQCVAVH